MPEIPEIFKYKKEEIHGIIHEPEPKEEVRNRNFVVFLHGWAGYRLGPHNILVDIARNLSRKGFYCCRFDFRGRGYSDGKSEKTDHQTMLDDIQTVIDRIKETYFPDEIILLGICSGAKLAIHYALNGAHTINNVIELSSSLLKVEGNNNVELQAKKSGYLLGNYLKKVLDPQSWKKIRNHEINLKLIFKTIGKSLLNFLLSLMTKVPGIILFKKRNKRNNSVLYKTDFIGNVLSIHGGSDPETELSTSQVKALCLKYNLPLTQSIIPGANHNFYSVKWKAEIIEIINKWLKNIYS